MSESASRVLPPLLEAQAEQISERLVISSLKIAARWR